MRENLSPFVIIQSVFGVQEIFDVGLETLEEAKSTCEYAINWNESCPLVIYDTKNDVVHDVSGGMSPIPGREEYWKSVIKAGLLDELGVTENTRYGV